MKRNATLIWNKMVKRENQMTKVTIKRRKCQLLSLKSHSSGFQMVSKLFQNKGKGRQHFTIFSACPPEREGES